MLLTVCVVAAVAAAQTPPVTEAEVKDLAALLQVVADASRPVAERTAALQKIASGAPRTLVVFDATFGKAQGDARISSNESATLGNVRTMISAQAAYQSMNGGFYDTPACLGTPSRCLPSYPSDGPTMIDKEMAALTPRYGYEMTFHPGPAPAAAALRRAKASPTSLTSWAYVATPVKPGETGRRSFCGDDTGRVCFVPSGKPTVVGGRCGPECRPLP